MATALVGVALSSCSDDVLDQAQVSGDEIKFRATANHLTRAADSYCAHNLPGQFSVYARTSEGTPFITGDIATRVGSTEGYELNGGTRYWPNQGSLDFLSFHNDELTFNKDLEDPKFVDYVIKDNVAQQLDLIYAKEFGKSRPASNGNVNFNFRHALSQVVFRAKVTNPNFLVVVEDVAIGNLLNKGTFSFPADNTTSNWLDEDHTDVNGTRPDNTGLGVWSNLSSTKGSVLNSYSVATAGTPMINGDDIALSSSPAGHLPGSDWSSVMTLLPQENEAWKPGVAGDKGSYLRVKCSITNLDGENKTLLHSGYVYVPLEVKWEQGIRYVYTINFGNGHAGYIPDVPGGEDPDNPNPPVDPKPTLQNISVTCSVDDFIPAGSEDENIKYTVNYYYNDQLVNCEWQYNNPEFLALGTFTGIDLIDTTKNKFLGWSSAKNSTVVDYDKYAHISLTPENNTLNLYAVVRGIANYKVIREYHFNGEKVASMTTGTKMDYYVNDVLSGALLDKEHPNWKSYTVDEVKYDFEFEASIPDSMTLLANSVGEVQYITMRYVYNTPSNDGNNTEGTEDTEE